MVNKTQFYKTKVALAVVLSLGLAACGDSEGDAGSVSNSNSQVDAPSNTVGAQDELSVTVSGVVVDTNNNPIEGASVYLAGETVVTDAGGIYVFSDVNVTNVVGVNNEGNENSDSISDAALTLTVVAPAGYLGGTITLTPQAQVNNTGGQGAVTAGDGADGATCDAGDAVAASEVGSVTTTSTDGLTTTVTTVETGAVDPVTGDQTTVTTVAVTGTAGTTTTTTETAVVAVGDAGSCTAGSGGSGGSATNGSNSDTTTQTFVSGYSYGAAKAVLPALTANVTGYLVDCTETTYHKVISGATVAADILSLGTGADTSTATAGSSFELSTQGLSTTTGDNGQFTITLPADSIVQLLTDDWGLDTGSDSFADTNVIVASQTTNNEQITQNIGIIDVCPFETPDTTIPNVAPMFASIDGQTTFRAPMASGANDVSTADATAEDITAVDATYAGLDEGIVNDFAINFTEALPNLTIDDIRVYVGDPAVVQNPTSFTITLNAAMDGFVLTFAEDLDAGVKVEVAIARWLAEDADGADFVNNGSSAFGFDSVPVDTARLGDLLAAKAQYASIRFCTFIKADPLDGDASVTLIEQIIDADDSEDGNLSKLAEYSSVFADNISGDTTMLSQLNSAEPTFVEGRLFALAEAIEIANGGTASGLTFDVDDAIVSYEDATGTVTVAVSPTATSVTSPISGNGDILVEGTEDAAVVTATAKNVFGDTVATSSVTVYDKIAPTTVLQESYNITNEDTVTPVYTGPKATEYLVTTGGSTAVQFGDGGEATGSEGAVQATIGNPIIFVQPRHLVARNANLSAAIRGDEFDALTADMENRLLSTETGTLDTIYDRPTYDATAYAAWGSISQDIGISISEDISIVAGSALSSANISTAITAPKELNDTVANVDATTGPNITQVDLVQVTVADVVALANTDHGGTLSLEGVIADTSEMENVADAASNAQVVFEDAFPPMVTDARWDGTTLTVKFNEAIELPGANAGDSDYNATTVTMNLVNPITAATFDTITLNGAETTATTDGYFTWDAATNTLAITHATAAASWAGNATTEGEFFYDDDSINDAGDEQHGLLVWDSILDTHGNKWSDFHSSDMTLVGGEGVIRGDTTLNANDSALNRWEVNAPQFLAVNELGQFNIAWAWSGVVDGDSDGFDDDGIAQVTVTFSHPIDTTILDTAGNNDTIIQQGELLSLFSIDVDGTAAFADLADTAGNLALTISADNKTITIDLAEAANVITGINVDDAIISVGDTALTGTTTTAESSLTVETTISTLRLTTTSN
jgi:hypothetical protein